MFATDLELELDGLAFCAGPIHPQYTNCVFLVVIILLEIMTNPTIIFLIPFTQRSINTANLRLHIDGIKPHKLKQTHTIVFLIIQEFLDVLAKCDGFNSMVFLA